MIVTTNTIIGIVFIVSTKIRNTFRCLISIAVIISICQIGRSAPIGFNGYRGNTIRYIKVSTLREYATTFGIQILCIVSSVCKIVASPRIRGCESTLIATNHTCYLPAGNNFVLSTVACTHFTVIGQLDLIVVKIEVVRVLIGTLKRDR